MKKWKFSFWYLIPIVLIVFIGAFPTFFSIFWAKDFVEKRLKKSLSLERVEIGSIHLSWLGPQKIENILLQKQDFKIEADHLSIHQGLLHLKTFKLKSLLRGKILINEGSVEIKNSSIKHVQSMVHEKKNNLVFKLSGNTEYFMEEGYVEIIAREGLNRQSLKVLLKKFPIEIVETLRASFFPKDTHSMKKILGNFLDLNCDIQLNQKEGPIELQMVSPLCSCEFKGQLRPKSITFTSPFKLSLHMTKEFYHLLYQNNLFHSINSVESILPIQVLIDTSSKITNEFAKEFSFSGEMHVDLANMTVNMDQSFFTVLGFLPTKFSGKDIELWFTPVNISVKDHVATLDRCDFLVSNKIHLATWGETNLKTKVLDMSLGVPVETLFDAIKLPITSHNKTIVFPIKGKLGNIKIDQELAKKQLSLILSQTGTIGTTLTSPFIKTEMEVPASKPLPWKKKGLKGLFNIIKLP